MKKKYGLLFILSFAVVINTGCTGDQQTILGQASTPTMTLTAPTPDEEASQEAPGKEETDSPADAVDDDETEEPASVPIATEVKHEYTYTVTPEIRNFRECKVTEKELLDGTYWHWLNDVVAPTLLEDFKAREDQIRDDVPLNGIGLPSGGAFFYEDGDENGVYADEERTSPWNRWATFGVTEIIDPITNEPLEYLILPVFYYDKDTQQVFPVVTVMPIFHSELMEESMNVYLKDMNMPIIIYTDSYGAFVKENITMSDMTDPLVSKVYGKLGQDEVWDRTQRFYQRDYSAFSSPDMVVGATIISSKFFR